MIIDREETTLLARQGWGVEGMGLWRLRAGDDDGEPVPILPQGFAMSACASGVHVLFAHDKGRTWTIRRIDDVETVLASAVWDGEGWTLDGDASIWEDVPRYVKVDRGDGLSGLVRLAEGPASIDPLNWFWDGPYDHGWQGLFGPVEIPGESRLIFPVQRDSHPVIYDPEARRVVGRLTLSGSHGNPSLRFLRTRPELWADDRDTLLRLRTDTWDVMDSQVLQGASDAGVGQFIGDFWIPYDERVCFVARPFSGDVLTLDTDTFTVTSEIQLGRQPLEVARLGDELIARDWKTRSLMRAELPDQLRRQR